MSRYKWTDSKNHDTAKRLGKYPYQFVFDQEGDIFHHYIAQKRFSDFDCKDGVSKVDSDMTFAGALQSVLKGELEPCPDCLGEFPTSVDELSHTHFPEQCSISMSDIRAQYG